MSGSCDDCGNTQCVCSLIGEPATADPTHVELARIQRELHVHLATIARLKDETRKDLARIDELHAEVARLTLTPDELGALKRYRWSTPKPDVSAQTIATAHAAIDRLLNNEPALTYFAATSRWPSCEGCGKPVEIGESMALWEDDIVTHEKCPTETA